MAQRPRTHVSPAAMPAHLFKKTAPPQMPVWRDARVPAHDYRPPAHTAGARLHIGCGPRRLPGWINADAVPGVGDVVLDLHDPHALARDTYAVIYGCHVLEHCWPQDTPAILRRMFAALLPGGTLRLSVPDIRLVVKNCIDGHAYGDERSALAVIYGGNFSRETSAPDLHRQTFWRERLARLLTEAGFVNVREWGRGQYPAIDQLGDYATKPHGPDGKSLISLNLEADRPGALPKLDTPTTSTTAVASGAVDVSVLLGTVNRPEMLRECVEAVRKSVAGFTYEIVIAYGADDDTALPWMREQADVVPVLGGMDGAIEAFNRAYAASRGRYICQLNDDVIVDGDAIGRAVRHLASDMLSAGVVFKFDRGDGKGYRHERLAGAIHPNQIVARRETCEAVVERIGAFWGDAAHRTDKTYGGDSAFGVVCKHLGLRLDSVDGVTCRDLLAPDELRARNKAAVAPDHGQRWIVMFEPYMTTVAQPAADEWPALYVPRVGMPPRRSPVDAGRPLRLLHLSLKSAEEPQVDMREAFAKIGPTIEAGWRSGMPAALEAARAHRPDVVFAQIQSDEWTPQMTNMLRSAVGPSCTLVMWTGDVRTSALQPVERWLAQRGREFDIVLASNTTYPRKLKLDEKVTAACGYMSCGVEGPQPTVLAISEDPDAGAVFLGANYRTLDSGARERLFGAVAAAQPCPLALHGRGWERHPAGRPFASKADSRAIIRRTPLTIVTSLFTDLGRYTSDRLARTAAAGGVIVVREFDDMRGFGLRPGVNCLVWHDEAELIDILRAWSRPDCAASRRALRDAAVELARRQLTWDHTVEELLAIVRDFRARRGLS
jgi:hypothetical protein